MDPGALKRLPRSFSARPALVVARELLGQVLVRAHPHGARGGRIVETEAYVGPEDLACHAAKGRTKRTEVMFGPAGRAYVYLIYGMYDCFNVVVEPKGVAAAVLVRGLEPLFGLEGHGRTDGPGRLCRALGITRADNGLDLQGEVLYLAKGKRVPDAQVRKSARIGVDYAGPWARKPYRFFEEGNAHVSRARGLKAVPLDG